MKVGGLCSAYCENRAPFGRWVARHAYKSNSVEERVSAWKGANLSSEVVADCLTMRGYREEDQ